MSYSFWSLTRAARRSKAVASSGKDTTIRSDIGGVPCAQQGPKTANRKLQHVTCGPRGQDIWRGPRGPNQVVNGLIWPDPARRYRVGITSVLRRCGCRERPLTGGVRAPRGRSVARGLTVQDLRRVRFTAPPASRARDRSGRPPGSGKRAAGCRRHDDILASAHPPRGGCVRIWHSRGCGDHDGRRRAPLAVGPRGVPPAPRQAAGRGSVRAGCAGGGAA